MTRINHTSASSVQFRERPPLSRGQHFGALLSKYRKQASIAVKDLAKRTKLSTLAVLKIENGTRMPTPKSVDALIGALNLNEHEAAMLKESSRAAHQFGAVIKEEREKRGLSMRDVANEVGLSHGALQKIESGLIHPTISTVLRIADSLHLEGAAWGQFLSYFMRDSDFGTIDELVVLEIIRQAGIEAAIEERGGQRIIGINLGAKERAAVSVAKI